MSALRTGEHILNVSCERGGQIVTNGEVFASCSCGEWRKNGCVPRREARELHRAHFDAAVAAEQEEHHAVD